MRFPTRTEWAYLTAILTATCGSAWTVGPKAMTYLESDAPPLVGQARVTLLAQNFSAMALTQQHIADQVQRLSDRADSQDLDHWNAELDLARARLKANPSDSLAIEMKKTAEKQVRALLKNINTAHP